jgi:hypothetical protein
MSLVRHVQYVCTSGIGIEPFSSKLLHPAQWNWKAQEPTSLSTCTVTPGEGGVARRGYQSYPSWGQFLDHIIRVTCGNKRLHGQTTRVKHVIRHLMCTSLTSIDKLDYWHPSIDRTDIRSLFLAHLSWKLKWAFLIACCPSVCLSVRL